MSEAAGPGRRGVCRIAPRTEVTWGRCRCSCALRADHGGAAGISVCRGRFRSPSSSWRRRRSARSSCQRSVTSRMMAAMPLGTPSDVRSTITRNSIDPTVSSGSARACLAGTSRVTVPIPRCAGIPRRSRSRWRAISIATCLGEFRIEYSARGAVSGVWGLNRRLRSSPAFQIANRALCPGPRMTRWSRPTSMRSLPP